MVKTLNGIELEYFVCEHESILDHNPTNRELTDITGTCSIKKLIHRCNLSKDGSMDYIAWLYHSRGDDKTAELYLNAIEDNMFRYDAFRCLFHS